MSRTWVSRALLATLTATAIGMAATPAHAAASTGIAQPAAAVAVRGSMTVRVVAGDTAWGLAARHCDRGDLYRSIAIRSPEGRERAPARIWPRDIATIGCARAGAGASRGPAASPVMTGWVHPLPNRAVAHRGGCFGDPRRGHSHAGVDLIAPAGMAIRAVHAGVVVISGWGGGAGWYVMVDHGGGIQTVSMHMVARPPVRVGQRVATGQMIGRVGSTGDSSGPHLHFETHMGRWVQRNPGPIMLARGVRVGC